MNMGDCFLRNRQTYSLDHSIRDNSGEHADCGESLLARWRFVKDKEQNYYLRWQSTQLPDLLNIEEDFKLFKVLQLSSEQMTLEFYHQFGSKQGKITDVYVPENVKVEGRDFHW